MKSLGKKALAFAVIGLLLYGAADYAAERLLYRTGDTNPFFKIETAKERSYDWAILGASHAMPLDFADFNAFMERESGLRIINLAVPGAGPLYMRFVFETFLERLQARNLLYIADSFAFYSRAWNEERFADAGLLRRTPFDWSVALRLAGYVRSADASPTALLDYLAGFSKLNNRERFQPDVWEGAAQFEKAYRPSAAADRKRIEYLYGTAAPDAAALARYLQEFTALVDLARRAGMRVVVVKTPVPASYRSALPGEAAFDEALARVLGERQVPLRDFSATLNDPRLYFDTDHLNRTGATQFFTQSLKPLLKESGPRP
jgi:hypothetical protein